MRWWLTIFALTATIAAGWAQQRLTIQWLSFVLDTNNAKVPIRIDPSTGLVDLTNGVFVDSRFASISADGTQVVFQVGNGQNAQVWQAIKDTVNNLWQVSPVPIPQTAPPQPLTGVHSVISTDGNHIAFTSWKDYRPSGQQTPFPKSQIYLLDRQQNKIMPVSFLWRDRDGDGLRDSFDPCAGNCIPVHVSSNGSIVVFLAEWLPDTNIPPQVSALNIVDTNGDGVAEPIPSPPNNASGFWLVLIHNRDADGNGVYDEAGIGATTTFLASVIGLNNDNDGLVDEDPADGLDNDNDGRSDEDPVEPIPAAAVSVSANGRFIAFMTTYDNDNDGLTDEDPVDNADNDGDGRTDEDPPDERWRIIVRDWQTGAALTIDDAFAPVLSDDGTYLAYLTPTQIDNDGDGRLNEDDIDNTDNDNDGLVDEDPIEAYPQTTMDLLVRQLIDPRTGQPPAQVREIRLSDLQLPLQGGTVNGAAGWGYSDWWGAVTIAVDPTNPNIVYSTFHAWSTDLIDLRLVSDDLIVDGNPNAPNRLNFYQGIANIFLSQFDFTNYDNNPQSPNRVRIWRLIEWTNQQLPDKRRGVPVSLELFSPNPLQYRLTLAPSMFPAVGFVLMDAQGNWALNIVFQTLAPFERSDGNGLWDIYLATVLLP